MAISGKCYLSLHEFNKSANRGACYQTCRRAYTVADKESGYQLDVENEYIMSPKDLKTIGFLNKILDAGVRVLKIEGRARSSEYVKTVVECYSEAVEAWIQNIYSDDKIDNWNQRLSSVFNRGFWDGYYLGQKLGEWSNKYGSQATRRKIYIGKCRNYFSKIGVAEFRLETAYALEKGDELLITGETTGALQFTPSEYHVDMQLKQNVTQNEVFSIKTPNMVRRGDKLFKIVDADKVRQQ
jgi:putative protease